MAGGCRAAGLLLQEATSPSRRHFRHYLPGGYGATRACARSKRLLTSNGSCPLGAPTEYPRPRRTISSVVYSSPNPTNSISYVAGSYITESYE